ncbi:hypothetical protein CsSME_00007560 [Camellia sinensis var. sinensis]
MELFKRLIRITLNKYSNSYGKKVKWVMSMFGRK